MIEKKQRIVKEEWEKTGGASPLGEYPSFQDAVIAANDKGIFAYNALSEPMIVTCIDDGINAHDVAEDLGLPRISVVRTAGAGILARERQKTIFQNNKDQIRGIVSHRECGAAGIYAQNNNLEGDIDTIADQAAMQVAQNLKTTFMGRITPRRRPFGLHVARAIYYDGTERGFEASKVETLPIGFGISRGFAGREAGMDNARLAKSIALGETGFGNQFTEETPLYLVGISDNKEGSIPSAVLRGELEEIKDSSNIEVKLIKLAP